MRASTLTALVTTLFAGSFYVLGQPDIDEYYSIPKGGQVTAQVVSLNTKKNHCQIRYRYHVNGQEYYNDAVSQRIINRKSSVSSGLCKRAHALSVGKDIPVRYDPAQPEHALAYSRFPYFHYGLLGLMILSWINVVWQVFSPVRGQKMSTP